MNLGKKLGRFFLALLLLFSWSLNAAVRKKQPKIRVRIDKQVPKVTVVGTDLKRVFHHNKRIKYFSGRKKIRFHCDNLKNTKLNKKKPVLLASLSSQTGLVGLADGAKYKGDLHLVKSVGEENCDLIQESNLEDYLPSLLSKEMNASWPLEALKAQAIAARTYALHKIDTQQVSKSVGFKTFYDLESSEKHQVSGHYLEGTPSTKKATRQTEGEVLLDPKGRLKPLFFHARCGGRTLRPDQVWQNRVHGYRSVICDHCRSKAKKGKSWSYDLGIDSLNRFLAWGYEKKYLKRNLAVSTKSTLKIVPDRRVKSKLILYIDGRPLKFEKSLIRRYFGRFKIPSNRYEAKETQNGLRLYGSGLGHGVGMCQVGALSLAKRGWDYKKILAYYFPHFKLKKVY